MIRFMKESQKQAWFIENDIIWYPVKEILNTGKIEDVYNIEVKEDHTYTANNMITFNCQDFSVAGKQKGSVWTCKDCGHEYNPLTVHWSQRDQILQPTLYTFWIAKHNDIANFLLTVVA